MPPMSAPIDVPATATISKPRSSSTSIAPIWASPFAAPAPSASATRGFRGVSLAAGKAPGSAMSISLMQRRRSVVVVRTVLVAGEGQLEQDLHFFAKRQRRNDLGIGAVFEDVHQQLARIRVRHLEFVAAIRQRLTLLLRMPVFVGHPTRGVRRETNRRPGLGLAGEDAVARRKQIIELGVVYVLCLCLERLRVGDAIHRETAQCFAVVVPDVQVPV